MTTDLHRYEGELAIAALLVLEILELGALNPRLLDLNVLLFSTRDFICILCPAFNDGDCQRRDRYFIWLDNWPVRNRAGCHVPGRYSPPTAGGCSDSCPGRALRCDQRWADYLHGFEPTLVITLGILYLFGGSALLLSRMAGATGYEGIGGFPQGFTDFANLAVLRLLVPLIFFLVCVLFLWLLMHRSHTGRNVFLIGQSARGALYSAIQVNRTLYTLYAMTGFASAVAAVLLVSYFGSARSELGSSFLMSAITAVVLDGANIYGGSWSILGTAIAALLVGYLQQGLQMASGSNQVSSALSNALLIVVVVGRSVSLHRQQTKDWLARRRANRYTENPLP